MVLISLARAAEEVEEVYLKVCLHLVVMEERQWEVLSEEQEVVEVLEGL